MTLRRLVALWCAFCLLLLVGCDAYAPDARPAHHRPDTSRHVVPTPDA